MTHSTTAAAHYNALPATERVSLYGLHLFQLTSSSAAAPNAPCAQVRLSSLDWTPCESLAQAQELHQGYLDQWRDEGMPDRDLASSFGYVADSNGHITNWISRNGLMHSVRYLGSAARLGGYSGPLANKPLTAAVCSLANDQADRGALYYHCGADVWLQEQHALLQSPRQGELHVDDDRAHSRGHESARQA